jgi:hypothetical protein
VNTAPTIERAPDGSTVIRLPPAQVTVAAPDELVHRGNAGIESRAFDTLVASGELPSRKIGRRVYVRRSDLLRLVDAAPVVADEHDELGAAVARRAARKASR